MRSENIRRRSGVGAEHRCERGARANAGRTDHNGVKRARNPADRRACIAIAEFQKNTFGIAVPLVFDHGHTIMSLGGGSARLDVKETAIRRTIAPDLIRTAAQVLAAIADAGDLDS